MLCMKAEVDTSGISADTEVMVNVVLSDPAVVDGGKPVLAWGPESAVMEEERLQRQRQQAKIQPAAKEMNAKDSKALAALLDKSAMFSKFMAGNLTAAIAQHDVTLPLSAAGAAAAATIRVAPPVIKAEPAAAAAATRRGRSHALAGSAPLPFKPAKKARAVKRQREEEVEEEAEVVVAPHRGPLPSTQALLVPQLRADLRDYQLHGIKWMVSLYNNGMNGILADQMGLGKTVQTIGFLSHLKAKGVHGPFLVLGPLSTVTNWMNEFAKFYPGMPTQLYHGTKAERMDIMKNRLKSGTRKACPADFPVIITSYEILMADIKELQQFSFKYIIVDEGHRLKNSNCKLVRELKTLKSQNRMLLTGTPLQNNLAELWSLLHFIMPDIFASLENFESWFDFSDVGQESSVDMATEQRGLMVSKLHDILKPFVLRRVKADVDIALPGKSEILLFAPMTEQQIELNKQLLDKTILEDMARMVAEGGGSMAGASKLNNVLMQMRKNCNHPDLITSAFTQDIQFPTPEVLVAQCGKMALLDRLLKQLHARGHKVLIFSQMTKMLDIMESYLEQLGHTACRIDGSVPFQERQDSINAFNNDPNTWLFLLSTRAGGLGINLTGADTVIIYDSDWNPHQDMQAMDRCHRIGQTKPVLVFRLATAHSVEGKMLKRAEDKLMLERLVIKKGAFKHDAEASTAAAGTSMSAAELMDLLRPECSKEKDVPQSGVISDQVLTTLLDRSHLKLMAFGQTAPAAAYPRSGVGYSVLAGNDGSSMLNTIDEPAAEVADRSPSVEGSI